jgi:hypothetical protein
MAKTRFGQRGVGGRIFTVRSKGEKRFPVPLIQPETRHNPAGLISPGQTVAFNSADLNPASRTDSSNPVNLGFVRRKASGNSAKAILLGRDGIFRPVSICLSKPGWSCGSESVGFFGQDEAFRTESASLLQGSKSFRSTNPAYFQGNRPFLTETTEMCAKCDRCALDDLNFRSQNPFC